jgi:hypothetical protein
MLKVKIIMNPNMSKHVIRREGGFLHLLVAVRSVPLKEQVQYPSSALEGTYISVNIPPNILRRFPQCFL